MKQKVSGFTRGSYTYKRRGKTVRVPTTKVPDYKRKKRGKGKLGKKRRLVRYKPRRKQVDVYGQFY